MVQERTKRTETEVPLGFVISHTTIQRSAVPPGVGHLATLSACAYMTLEAWAFSRNALHTAAGISAAERTVETEKVAILSGC